MNKRFLKLLSRIFHGVTNGYIFDSCMVVAFNRNSGLLNDVLQAMVYRSHWDPVAASFVYGRSPIQSLRRSIKYGAALYVRRRLLAVGVVLNSFPQRPRGLSIPRSVLWESGPVIWWARVGYEFGDDTPRPFEGSLFSVMLYQLDPKHEKVFFLVPAEFQLDGRGYKPVTQLFRHAVTEMAVIHWHRAMVLGWLHPPVKFDEMPDLEQL
jgi:hypothetical protein